jgi:hypothetical protein
MNDVQRLTVQGLTQDIMSHEFNLADKTKEENIIAIASIFRGLVSAKEIEE